VNLEDLELCKLTSEKLIAASVDLKAQLRGNSTADGIPAVNWQQEFAAYTTDVRPEKERLNAAMKSLCEKQRKMAYITAVDIAYDIIEAIRMIDQGEL
jgi:hypothetical protein